MHRPLASSLLVLLQQEHSWSTDRVLQPYTNQRVLGLEHNCQTGDLRLTNTRLLQWVTNNNNIADERKGSMPSVRHSWKRDCVFRRYD